MTRRYGRNVGEGCCIQVLIINDKAQEALSQKSYYIENISKGGFRFTSNLRLELEDRMKVLLRFPDGRSQEVLGRICYCDSAHGEHNFAYGFSVLEGFYALPATG